MDWDEILDLETEWEETVERAYLGPIRTPEYWEARRRRVERLRLEVESGRYRKPALLIAECILLGRPKWGESFIDEQGRRVDECD